MIPVNRDRIEELFKPFGWVLQPVGCFLFCLAGWLISSLLSHEAVGMAYIWVGIGLIIVCIQLERPWLNRLPFPPLTTLVFTLNLRWIMGGYILLISENQERHQIFISHIAQALPLTLVPSACLVILGWLINRKFVQKRQADIETWNTDSTQFKDIILCITFITGIIAIAYVMVGAFGGTLDRGENYARWAGRFWRPDTVLSALIRLRDLFYVCLPLAIWQSRRSKLIILALSVPTITALLISVTLGGRGLVIYPILLVIGGSWIAGINAKTLKILLATASVGILIFSLVIGSIRGSEGFKSSSVFNLQERFSGLKNTLTSINSDRANYITHLGVQIYTHSDPYLFTSPASEQGPVGTKRLNNLVFLWVPRLFLPNRPEVNDGHLIANEIRSQPNHGKKEGRYRTFRNVSFGADLYWRFRWFGVIIGSALFGAFYALASRFWYRYASLNGEIYGVLLALFPSTFLQGPPLRSVSETAWNWLYEFPKYLIVLFALGFLIKSLIKNRKHRTQLS